MSVFRRKANIIDRKVFMAFISKTPEPPYYAVIFTSINADVDHTEHVAMSHRMVELATT
jgi:hypothetical protein